MAFGNPEQIGQILIHFADDTVNDLGHLNAAISQKNIDDILLLTHRIAGRTAQIGAGSLSKNYRLAELALRKSSELSAEWLSNINDLSAELNAFIVSVREIAANEVAG
jgi:HPt (histidine-containing phosphotransfer) domain-containing protein